VFQCHQPFAIIEDVPLQWILKMLYVKVETPSEKTISRDIKEIYSISKVNVGKVLQVCSGVFEHIYTVTTLILNKY
jgi:hypothetical protein